MPALPFDRVVLGGLEGRRAMSAAEFLALALEERIRSILRREVEFYLRDNLVERREALDALRRWKPDPG